MRPFKDFVPSLRVFFVVFSLFEIGVDASPTLTRQTQLRPRDNGAFNCPNPERKNAFCSNNVFTWPDGAQNPLKSKFAPAMVWET
jgi:hypothetical protein